MCSGNGGGGAGVIVSGGVGGGNMQPHGDELMPLGDHDGNSTIANLLREGEGAEAMPLRVP